MKTCQHCKRNKPCRPRGLCTACFRNVAIRNQYETHAVYGKRGVPDVEPIPLWPHRPTLARPGSTEKVDIMEWRAETGQALWHPDDAGF